MKPLVLTILLSAASVAGFSQHNKHQVKGKINAYQKPLQGAAVTVLSLPDSAVVANAITNKEGEFALGIANFLPQAYSLKVSSIGYENSWKNLDTNDTLVHFNLKPTEKQLSAVTVTSKKPYIEVKADKTIVNVEANPASAGSNALEVLQKIPGVTVSKDGKISLKGKENVLIYIDGKPTYMSNTEVSQMLQSMNSSQLEIIELQSNPSAKYDAAGNAGIINIKTKKHKNFGLNGSVTLGAGVARSLPRFNESININYRQNKFNLTAGLSHNYRERYENLSINRNFYNSQMQLQSIFQQNTIGNKYSKNYYGNFGVEYLATKKTTVYATLKTGLNNRNDNSTGNIYLFNKNMDLDSSNIALANNSNKNNNFNAAVGFKHNIDTLGQEITFDADFVKFYSKNVTDLANSYRNKLGVLTPYTDRLVGNLPQNINIVTAKTDYTLPINTKTKLEAGGKFSTVTTNADAVYDSIINNVAKQDIGRTNYFKYNENIYAAYASLNRTINAKLSIQAGLRFERTEMNGKQTINDSSFNRAYNQLFPTFYVQYSPSAKHSFTLNYGKRITRPDYEDLNPFYGFLDKYTYNQGNTELQPQYSHNLEFSHTYNQFLTTSVEYSNTNNVMMQIIEARGKSESVLKQQNVANRQILTASVNAMLPINKWLMSNIYTAVVHNNTKGTIEQKQVGLSSTNFMFNISNTAKFKNGYTATLEGFYMTGEMEGVFVIKPMYSIDAGISKQIMNNKGLIKLSVSDVLFSQKANGYSKYNNVDVNFTQTRNSQAISLSFTYKFKRGQLKATQVNKKQAAAEEQSRIKGN